MAIQKSLKILALTLMVVISTSFAVEQPAAADKIDLKLNLQKGQKFGMKIVQQQKISQTIMGQKQDIDQTTTMEVISEVLDIDANSIYTIKQSYDKFSVKSKIVSPAGTIEIDSSKPADPNNPQAKAMSDMYKAMEGMSFVMKTTPKGKCVGVEGFDEMLDKMVGGLAGDDKAKEAIKQMLKGFISEDRIKEMGDTMMGTFPDEPVGIGSVWYDITSLGGGFPMDMDATYVLKERKDGIAILAVTSKMDMGEEGGSLIEMQGIKMNMQMTGIQTGTAEIDETTGWTLRGNTTQNFTGVMKMEPNPQMPDGMVMPMTIQGTVIIEPMDVK